MLPEYFFCERVSSDRVYRLGFRECKNMSIFKKKIQSLEERDYIAATACVNLYAINIINICSMLQMWMSVLTIHVKMEEHVSTALEATVVLVPQDL